MCFKRPAVFPLRCDGRISTTEWVPRGRRRGASGGCFNDACIEGTFEGPQNSYRPLFKLQDTNDIMGLFSSNPSPASTAADGSYKPMKREERKACWEARDAYFSCLDKNKILDSIKDADGAAQNCGGETKAFERDCASSWVSLGERGSGFWRVERALTEPQVQYFKQKRVADWEREQKILKLQKEGAIPMDQANQGSKWKPW